MEQIFDKIPISSVDYVRGLISYENIIFKLKKSRRTKQGDFSIKYLIISLLKTMVYILNPTVLNGKIPLKNYYFL